MAELVLTREQIRSIDSRAVEEFAMPGVILMENAGRGAAEAIQAAYAHLVDRRVAIACGPGNNGGDGYVIARHLHNAGWSVRVIRAVDAAKIKGDASVNFEIARRMSLSIEPLDAAGEILGWADLVVDALLGTGVTGAVKPPLDDLIRLINDSGKPVVAVDVPSGLDCGTGQPAATTVRAAMTVTFVAVKSGMTAASARPYVGKTHVAGIGVPAELIRRVADGGGED